MFERSDKLTDYMLSPSLALLAVEWKKISFQNMRSFQGWYFSTCSKYWYDLYWRDQICEQGRESEIINEKEAALESESGLMKHEPVLERRESWVRRPRKGRWWCSETRRSWSGQIWRERRWSPRKIKIRAPWVWGRREWAERVASELSSHPWRPFWLLPFPERLCLSSEVFQVLSSSSLGPTLALPSMQVLRNSKGVGVPAQNNVFWGFCIPFGKNNQGERIYSRGD